MPCALEFHCQNLEYCKQSKNIVLSESTQNHGSSLLIEDGKLLQRLIGVETVRYLELGLDLLVRVSAQYYEQIARDLGEFLYSVGTDYFLEQLQVKPVVYE